MKRIPIAVACIDLGAAVIANSKPTTQEYLLKQFGHVCDYLMVLFIL